MDLDSWIIFPLMKDNFSYEFPTSLFWRIEKDAISGWYVLEVSKHSHFPAASDHTQRPQVPVGGPVDKHLPLGECTVWADVLTSNLKWYFV